MQMLPSATTTVLFVSIIQSLLSEQPDDQDFVLVAPNRVTPLREARATWNRKEVSPLDDVYLNGQWKLPTLPEVAIPVVRAPYPTFGMVMPLPFFWSATEVFYPVDTTRLLFEFVGVQNYILQAAIDRYRELISSRTGLSVYAPHWSHAESRLPLVRNPEGSNGKMAGTAGARDLLAEQASEKWSDTRVQWIRQLFDKNQSSKHQRTKGPLSIVRLYVKSSGADWPSLHMDESYELYVEEHAVYLVANETWGALRALESLSQLMWRTSDKSQVYINQTYIVDKPRFAHRGLLVDTSRHYISKAVLLTNLEAMAYHKMNVFHWHIVDDHSFPFESQTYPELSKKGAFTRHQVYSSNDIREIVEFARLRGIRVIPEFDIPGHTRSLAYSRPELLSQCQDRTSGVVHFGPLNVFSNFTHEFLYNLFHEVMDLFPDEYMHLGGDEVESVCWETDTELNEARKRLGLPQTAILEYFWRRVQNVVAQMGKQAAAKCRKIIVWEEVFNQVTEVQKSLVMHIWKPNSVPPMTYSESVIFSSCWYLDLLYDTRKWTDYYNCDPSKRLGLSGGSDDPLIGGEACMWAEFQSDDTILQKIWPVTSAIAERLWSPAWINNLVTLGPRLEEQRCRMISRGIPQSVLQGPGTCGIVGALTASLESAHSRKHIAPTHGTLPETRSEWFVYFTAGALFGLLTALSCTQHKRLMILLQQSRFATHFPRRCSIPKLTCVLAGCLLLTYLFAQTLSQ